ncbi:TRAP transporter small permease [Brevibacillus sp. H7]|uniref:TRAP transporter small permease n=1 Tax=Brevibacillus sp. H7 TaxID=3349138 RepID=UPI0037F80D98
MQQAIKIIDAINKLLSIVLSVVLAVMALLIVAQVFTRYVVDISLTWSEEAARYLMVYSVFLGAALAIRYQKHVAIEILSESINEKARRIVKLIIMIICIVFFFMLLVKGIDILELVSRQKSPALRIPMTIPYAAIPIGAGLLILNSVAVILEMFIGKKEENH